MASVIAFVTRADNREITYYEDADGWPQIVHSTIEKLQRFDSETSMDRFGSQLHEMQLTETSNFQHWKDFEFYWTVEQNEKKPHYIIAGGFWHGSSKELNLVHATINEVTQPTGKWKTVWSIKYGEPKRPSVLRMKIR